MTIRSRHLAAGNFALGIFAVGIFAAGLFAAGIFSIGVFSIGIFSIGIFAISLFPLGIFPTGMVAGMYLYYKHCIGKKEKVNLEKNKGNYQILNILLLVPVRMISNFFRPGKSLILAHPRNIKPINAHFLFPKAFPLPPFSSSAGDH
jgi:hypothetical protein